MRRTAAFVTAFAIALTLSACSSAPGDSPLLAPSSSATPSPRAEGGAIGLVGLWRVSGTDGEGEATWLRLGADELRLWQGCEILLGSWRAGAQAFIAHLWGAAGSCVSATGVPEVDWLDSVASYERDGDGWVLRDVAGDVVATLSIDAAPPPVGGESDTYTQPPVVDDRAREALGPAAPLPEGLRAAMPTDLEGRWAPREPTATDPHVDFSADGTWSGSDGCNGAFGRWSMTEAFLSTYGPTTAIGCDGAMVPSWVGSARSAGFDGAELVLLDASGTELGRLVRD